MMKRKRNATGILVKLRGGGSSDTAGESGVVTAGINVWALRFLFVCRLLPTLKACVFIIIIMFRKFKLKMRNPLRFSTFIFFVLIS